MVRKSPRSSATIEFGQRLRTRRLDLGLSQERLAERCGLSWSYVSSVERGGANISLHNILRLAAALEMDVGDLLKGMRPPLQ